MPTQKNEFLANPQIDADIRVSVTRDVYAGIPKSVRIGCYTFAIKVSERADSIAGNEFGHTNFMSQKIRLAPDMLSQNLANTLLHECLHGVHWVYGLNNESSEEDFTTLGANGLCCFFQDNPGFMVWFDKANAL